MQSLRTADKDRLQKDRAKKAIRLAMQNRWLEAVQVNEAILAESPENPESYNRLGKALSELGRNREARLALQRALEISPQNPIAQKNLNRLSQLNDEGPNNGIKNKTSPSTFIEEIGKTGVTSVTNLASSETLLKTAPGHSVKLEVNHSNLMVMGTSGYYLGQIEPKLESRLVRLIEGGNRYDATVTSVSQSYLHIIIRESFQHPSQNGTVSFPSKGSDPSRIGLQNAIVGDETLDDETPIRIIKDWSDDDTEPGDDEAFKPVVHSIINPTDSDEIDEENY